MQLMISKQISNRWWFATTTIKVVEVVIHSWLGSSDRNCF